MLSLVLATVPIHAQLPGVVMEHGKYSAAYQSDWSTLGDARKLAHKDLTTQSFSPVDGAAARQSFQNQAEASVMGKSLRVTWNLPADKFKTSLFHFRECRRVIVDGLNVIQESPAGGYHTLFIEDCDEVIVRNCYFAGATAKAHIRIEGCAYVLVENVEIPGYDPDNKGRSRCGAGIFVNNGETGRGGPRNDMLFSENPRPAKWLTIQNCYIHDLRYADKWENSDAILIHSPPDGILFNCFVENWDMRHGDAAIDVGHRRADITGKVFRIERNVVKNCTLTKSPGTGAADNWLLWANNIFINSFHADYHSGYQNLFVHNTSAYSGTAKNTFYKLWAFGGPTTLRNGHVIATGSLLSPVYFQNEDKGVDKHLALDVDYMVYTMDTPDAMLSGKRNETIASWADWQRQKKDAHSILRSGVSGFTVRDDGFDMDPATPAAQKGSPEFTNPHDPRLKVSMDFAGKKRPLRPAVGALEP